MFQLFLQLIEYLLKYIIHFIVYLKRINIFVHVLTSNFQNMKNVEIPRRETKSKAINVPITPSEQKTLVQYSRSRKVKISDLIRFALKQTYDLNF